MRNFFETSSLRRTRLTFTILFSAVFILCTINAEFVLFRFAISNDQCAWREIPGTDTAFVITDIVPGGVSDVAGLKNGDILFGINGINITSNRNDTTRTYPMLLVNSLPKGSYAEYSIIRNGEFLKLKVRMEKVFSIFYAVNYLFGLCFLITGFIVVLSKPRGKTQRIYAYFTLFVMLICGLMQLNIQNYITTFEKVLYTILFIAGRVLGPVIILNFFSTFRFTAKPKAALFYCGAFSQPAP
ncbi:MAG: Serine phosphatase RsbU subunit sigma [Chlorobi bacterium OLB5]|nr:MAG: Serine phosphatase RsbU subunit sigma [Chlorobi bacterium OLB5]